MSKIPILLITHNRPHLLDKVLNRLIKYTPWDDFDLWILDNYSTYHNNLIIKAYTNRYSFIKVFSQNFNQISEIQNQIISKLKRDLYIKIDDDILVSDNWYKGFIGVYERNSFNISIGSVVIPINGFGWIPFLKLMGYSEDFSRRFSDIELRQGCTDVAVWNNQLVNKYIWEKTLDMDKTAETFFQRTKDNLIDYEVNMRYSIGAIIFSHDFWLKMGGWKLDNHFNARLKIRTGMRRISNIIAKIQHKQSKNRIEQIIDIITKTNLSALGIEEEYVFLKTKELGLKQYLTNESIVFHFAFQPIEKFLMQELFLDIKW
jgi:hypothetical protein